MSALILTALLLPAMTPDVPPAIKAAGPDLSGVYRIYGMDGATPYRGTATVWKSGDAYIVDYSTCSQGEKGPVFSNMRGAGVYQKGVLSVGWGGEKMQGATSYAVEGKELHGRWIMVPSNGAARTEQLTLLGKVAELE